MENAEGFKMRMVSIWDPENKTYRRHPLAEDTANYLGHEWKDSTHSNFYWWIQYCPNCGLRRSRNQSEDSRFPDITRKIRWRYWLFSSIRLEEGYTCSEVRMRRALK
jgi:hypothetical protein